MTGRLKLLFGLVGSFLAVTLFCGAIQAYRPLDANTWTAIGTLILAYSTTALFIVGAYQLLAVRKQIQDKFEDNKMIRTLDACNRYDFDPILDRSLRVLKEKKIDKESEYYQADASALKLDVLCIINYLDGIAIGIEQGIYIEQLAKDHLREILIAHCRDYLLEQNGRKFGVDFRNFTRLNRVYEKWVDPGTSFSNGNRGKDQQ